MEHFIAKYFTYHRVQWDDEPNFGGTFNYRISRLTAQESDWSAAHIRSEKTDIQISYQPAIEKIKGQK